MNKRRIETILMATMLLIVNGVIALWLQGHPLATAWASGLAGPAAAATIPASFSYQGTLRDATGALITGPVNLTLKLYKQPTGGAALHTESFANLNIRDGIFSVVVGDSTPALNPAIFDNPAVYIGIAVNGDPEMLPRQRLHPVPWAMHASTADKLSPGATVSTVTGPVTIDGNLTVNGALTAEDTQVSLGKDVTRKAILHDGKSDGSGQITQSEYDVNVGRYTVRARDGGATPTSVKVDQTLLLQLCGDIDGCTVRLAMHAWDDRRPLATVGPFLFSIGSENPTTHRRYWSSRAPDGTAPNSSGHTDAKTTGLDNDGSVEIAARAWDCFLIDGNASFANGSIQQSDNELGFELLNGNSQYQSVDMSCILIIED